MKLKHLAVMLLLLGLGCTSSDTSSDKSGSKEKDPAKSNETVQKADPAAETKLTEVSFNVEGMK